MIPASSLRFAARCALAALAAMAFHAAVAAGAEGSTLEVWARARRAETMRPWLEWREHATTARPHDRSGSLAPARDFPPRPIPSAALTSFPPTNVRINDPSGDGAGVAQVSPVIAAVGNSVLCAFTDGAGLVSPVGGVGIAWSADDGLTFSDLGAPVVAARTAGATGLFDQPWAAADPASQVISLVAVHYTDTGSDIECFRSADQGASWSGPIALSRPDESGAVAGPRVVALPGPPARLTAAWLSAGAIDADSYRVRTSGDGGLSWGAEVSACTAYHDFGSGPPGSTRGASIDFPALALDQSAAGPHRGRLYLAWQESVNFFGDTLYFSPPLALPPALEVEPDDDAAHATPFALGQTLRGTLSAGDQDWFSFAASAGQTVVLLVDSLDASLDPALRLICTDGATRLAYSAPGAGVGYGGQACFTLPESGTYFVRMSEAPGSAGAGGYRVRTALHHLAAGRARDHRDLFASHSDDGLSWSAPVLVTDDPGRFDDAYPELAVDGNGVAYAEWLDWRDAPAGACGGVSHTYLARSANGGDVFTSFGALADAPTAWTSVTGNLAANQGDHLALFANDAGVYPAWTDGRSGDPDIWGVTLSLSYLVTPTLISLLRVDADPTRVQLTWYEAGGLASAIVERRIEPGDWVTLATIVPDGSGYLSYTDRGLEPGALVHYRLASLQSPDGPWFGAVDIRVPLRAAFALDGAWPNPSAGAPRVRFSLDSALPATLELLDAAGRRILRSEVGALGAGVHLVQLALRGPLSPGVYSLRLCQGSRVRTARMVVMR